MRVSALTRASQCLLQNLDAWPSMQAMRVTPYQYMQVWDRQGLGEIRFAASDLGEPDLGHIVENRVIIAALWQQIARQARIEVLFGRQIDRLQERGGGAALGFADGSEIAADLLIGADGARSRLRELAGIPMQGRDYDQHGVVATVRAGRGNGATAWQRFMPSGPLALLPIQDELFSIVWSTSPAQAGALLDMPVEAFDRQLSEASQHCCGDLHLLGERAAFPLRLQRAATYVRPGLALVGDAADGFPGLPGWGAKSASLVLAHYQHIEAIPDDVDAWAVRPRGAARLAATLAADRESALLFRRLATLRKDAPVGRSPEDWLWKGPSQHFAKMCEHLGATGLVKRAERAAEGRPSQ